MNWDAVSAVADIVGLVAVVVSLLYVAKQIRQTTRYNRASSQQTVIDKTIAHGRWVAEDPARINIMRRALADYDGIPPDDQHVAFVIFETFLTSLENAHYFREAGICPEAVFRLQENLVLLILRTPGGQQFWRTGRYLVNDDGRRLIEALLARPDQGLPPIETLMPWLAPQPAVAPRGGRR
jgi:hypothetical protein